MRNIYKKHNGWGRLQQGALFSGAIADGVEENDSLFGLIITPRCDIANKKVSSIHYLPVIPFRLWKSEILSRSYQHSEYEKLSKKIVEFCASNHISQTLFDKKYNYTIEEIEDSIAHVCGYKDILNLYRQRCHTEDLEYCKEQLGSWSKGKDKVKELVHNKQAHYYLIEDWRDDNHFMVIMLRDVKRLDFSFAERMEKGISERILGEDDYHKNDIFKSPTGTMVYKIQQSVESPYLEHIMEAFSKNFCRIGIDRLDDSIINDLTNE